VQKKRLPCHLPVFLTEPFNAPGGVDDLLFAGVERVAVRTDFDVQRGFPVCGTGDKGVAARAGDGDFVIVRVDTFFHGVTSQ